MLEQNAYLDNQTDESSRPVKTKQKPNTAVFNVNSNNGVVDVNAEETDKEKAERSINTLLARNGVLPKEHPLMVYIESLFKRIYEKDDIEIAVFAGNTEPNAMATFNRKILLSKELIAMCETEEELIFVLHHELNHILKGHFELENETIDGLFKRSLFNLGEDRMKEVIDADLCAIVDLDNKGINISGSFSLMEKLMSIESKNKKGKDLTHGKAIERLILLKAALKAKDFKNIKQEQTPIPATMKDPELYADNYGFPVDKEMIKPDLRLEIRKRTIENMSPFELTVNLLDLIEAVAKKEDESTAAAQKYIKNSKELIQKMKNLLLEKSKLSNEQGSDELDTILQLTARIALIIAPRRQVHVKEITPKEKSKHINDVKDAIERDANGIYGDNDFEKNLLQIKNPLESFGYIGFYIREYNRKKLLRDGDKLIFDETLNRNSSIINTLFKTKGLDKKKASDLPCKNTTNSPEESINNEPQLTKKQISTILQFSIQSEADTLISNYKIDINTLIENKHLKYKICTSCQKLLGFLKDKINNVLNCVEIEELVTKANQLPLIDKFIFNNMLVRHLTIWSPTLTSVTDKNNTFLRLLKKFRFNTTGCRGPNIKDVAFLNSALVHNVNLFTGAISSMFLDLDAERFLKIIEKFNNDLDPMNRDYCVSSYLDKKGELTIQEYQLFYNYSKNNTSKPCRPKVISSLERHFLRNHEKRFEFKDIITANEKIDLFDKIRSDTDIHRSTDKLFYAILASHKWNLSNLEECLFLMRVCHYSENPIKKGILLRNVWDKILQIKKIKTISTPELLKIIPKSVQIPYETLETIIENESVDEKDFSACKEYIESARKHQVNLGKAIVAQLGVDNLSGQKLMDFLKAALNPHDDKAVKENLMHAWLFKNHIAHEIFDLERLEKFRNSEIDNNFNPDQIFKSLLLMNDSQRQAFVHFMLIGENGVLQDKSKVMELIEVFFEYFIEAPTEDNDRAFINEAKKIIKLAIANAQTEEIYFLISKLINKRIFKFENATRWEDTETVKFLKNDLEDNYDHDESDDSDDSIVYDSDAFNYNSLSKLSESEIQKEINLCVYGERSNTNSSFKNEKDTEYLFERGPTEQLKKLDAIGLLVEIAQSMGSIGVRFLQLMGLYIDVPAKYRDAFKQVYSDMQGQYKLTAHDTIVNNLPESERKNLKIGTRLGGGSILTAYPFETDKHEGIVKVVNPNVITEMENVFRVLELTFKKLSDENEEKYGPLLMMLDVIKTWIKADINLSAHHELDREFRTANSDQQSESGKYTSSVPQVLHYGDKLIMEEKVKGKTLQYSEKSKEELKDIIGLIRQQLFTQILSGIEHSDIHPGNFMISEDNKLHWLDRTLLLKLKPEEQALLLECSMCDTPAEMIQTFTKQIIEWPINEHLSAEKKKNALEKIGEILETLKSKDDLITITRRTLIELHKLNVKIPFNLIMTLKNLISVEMIKEQFAS